MEDKALLQILVDMLSYYKHQARMLVWVVVIVLVMHLATVIGFLYYESQFETTATATTTTTTQTVDGKDNDIVNGDQYNDKAQNKGVVNNVSDTNDNDNNGDANQKEEK
jgi:hypothetical protein